VAGKISFGLLAKAGSAGRRRAAGFDNPPAGLRTMLKIVGSSPSMRYR
jgi:hypothetical protein